MGTLLRYWLIPGWVRRLPRAVKWALGLACAVLLVPLPPRTYGDLEFILIHQPFGWTLYSLWCWHSLLLSPLVCAIGLFTGAISIAPERQNATWQALALTQTTSNSILLARALATWIHTAVLVLPAVALFCQGAELRHAGGFPIQQILTIVMETALRIATFVLIGMAISIRCKRVGMALSIAGALIAGCFAIYSLSPYPAYYAWFYFHSNSNLHAHLIFWPLTMLASSWLYIEAEWRLNLIADVIWGIVLPCICWAFLRRSYRDSLER